MDLQEIIGTIERLTDTVESFRVAVKENELKRKVAEIDKLSMEDPNFWGKKESKALLKQQATYKKFLEEWANLLTARDDLDVLVELYREGAEEVADDITKALKSLQDQTKAFELKLILSGPNDINNAIVTIHSGAGGTESNDWTQMLYRMYTRWVERMDYKFEVLDFIDGEEAGIKSVTFNVVGPYSFGYLKGEIGIHRLVRISPFDSQNRRHTSFSSVFVLPEIDDDIEIDIVESDLRIDTYRAGGAGGQHVNTTDSAVRITHIPTGIVVSCQNERSQHKNKASAMKILKARMYEHEMQKRNAEKDKLESSKTEIGWGNQIRSYVMHPYKMVKDLRTRHETGNVDAVMDGDLDPFIRSVLLHTAGISDDQGEN